jgi:hypothetical protein
MDPFQTHSVRTASYTVAKIAQRHSQKWKLHTKTLTSTYTETLKEILANWI